MPTPVNTARECLTEEAARALDDAVAIARRRSHAQTTSLHAVSALLAMPSSLLREVCVSRAARSTPYSSRLQFRALELCVGVSLDRLPSSSSKSSSGEEDPPAVSNSLMAAIKRSQANQRRHPEAYHLHQMHGVCQTATVLKVELKYFVLSILDDPIVNRVFCDAGFRSSDIKLDVLHPPVTTTRFSRCPPLFLCNLPSSDPNREFPFGGSSSSDENSRRIGQVLCRKERRRNPVLVGNCADEALRNFTDAINSGGKNLGLFLPPEIKGLSVINIEREISEVGSRANEETLAKLDELVNDSESNEVMLNLGELKVFLNSETSSSGGGDDALAKLVLKLSDLLKRQSKKKLWFIGCASSNETYTKLLDRFPKIDEDWDLHVLPITSSRLPKSSLMGSFVPFGGFFSSTSDYRVPLSGGGPVNHQTLPRCHLCNEKCLQEVAAVVKAGSSVSVADQCSEKLPSWLRAAETELDKGPTSSAKAVVDSTNTIASQTTALQKKWDSICQSIHQTPSFPKLGFQTVSPPPQLPVQTEKSVGRPDPKHKEDLTISSVTLSSPVSSVTTDLGLGVTYASKRQETYTPRETLNSSSQHKHHNDFKSLRESLSVKVPWQTEAVNAISRIICERRNRTNGIWLALLGPDRVGKKRAALALSEILFRDQANCISVDFGGEHCYVDDRFRGKTVVDYITGEVSRRPHSVVLLENVEKAEFPDQVRLSEGVSTGKLRDSHGRVISMKNVIVLATSSAIVKEKVEPVKFTEERVLSARSWRLQIKLADAARAGVNKRKHEGEETELRAEKVQRSYLDLNLPVDETETEEAKAWFDGFIEQLDEKVTFKQVDFDGLAKSIREKIVSHFELCFGAETQLEIDNEVMVQILAASWSSSREEEERNVVDQWIRTVLARSFAEARRKYGSNPRVAVKLVASRDLLAAGVELPEKVDVM
ncbi:Double Clp-N motif-containing P-loop nucleoside triphosphate hydrolases superfamily protein [Raphanus sativus]|uniref:Protein SMAX1-LIKE 6-like n=1 Tax=Raphanus sativus TaxID=3726 RepID=A0A6J0M1I6_RAPSA|nr:protein SMAX1-LIKE 6-like [Raphanus sativus]KAJ4868002.1 Double Clp-N motif-containing P-loop nucleoside triphosphate hydrolases superfamily protein [Raphanus sativus]